MTSRSLMIATLAVVVLATVGWLLLGPEDHGRMRMVAELGESLGSLGPGHHVNRY